jgi:hypothetical protein
MDRYAYYRRERARYEEDERQARSVNRKTVVLIHGLFSDGSRWDRTKAEFEAAGWNVVVIEYDSSWNSPHAMNSELDSRVPQDADLYVGHSYGGMYLDQSNIPSDRIVTINSPGARRGHNFNAVADPLNILDPASAAMSESVQSGGHSTTPSATQIINAQGNYNSPGESSRSMITYANRSLHHFSNKISTKSKKDGTGL